MRKLKLNYIPTERNSLTALHQTLLNQLTPFSQHTLFFTAFFEPLLSHSVLYLLHLQFTNAFVSFHTRPRAQDTKVCFYL